MKKIGIMSMQRIVNYGSFLQAYALKTILEELGASVEFVDYHVGASVVKGNVKKSTGIIRKLKKGFETFSYKAPLKHKIKYIKYKQSFKKKYMAILGVTEVMNYNALLDCLIIGSDEVFNCIQDNVNVGYSTELFGENNKSKRLMSFAASFGNTSIEKLVRYQKKDEISALLKRFDAISVRDDNSGQIVFKLTGIQPEYNLDPVLTYDYINCCDKIPQININEKYLILYAYSGRISTSESNYISNYAKEKKLKIYAFGGIQLCADKFIDCSPFEVLAYFKNAEEVITDTFHGSIFSVIAHRKFTTLVRKSVGDSYGNEEKIVDLLNRLGLTERMTTEVSEIGNINQKFVDYESVDILLEEQRKKAFNFLKKNIEF